MADAAIFWGLSNPGPDTLLLWLEPWAEEIVVPIRSTVILEPPVGSDDGTIGDMEWTSECLVVWANAKTVEVFIDDVRQETCSAAIPIPDGLSKQMLNLLFADQPAARLGGARFEAIERISWWQRLRLRLRRKIE